MSVNCNETLRIAILAPACSVHAIRLANGLSRRGYQIHLISMHDSGDGLDTGVVVHRLPYTAPFGYLLNTYALRRLLREIEPAVLNAHYATGYGTLATLCGFAPTVLSVWGSDVYLFPRKSRLHRWLFCRNIRVASVVCSTSHDMAREIRVHCEDAGPIEITPFGIDTSIFSQRDSEPTTDRLVIGTVKTLASTYGIDILIRSFAQLRRHLMRHDADLANKLHLILVGDGPERNSLEMLAMHEGVSDAVNFVGKVMHDQVQLWLHHFDIYVAVSRSESFGVAILEASATGIPVVVSRVGGLPEVVIDGETGMIVPKEDIESTTAAMLRLVQDEQLRTDMGRRGREFVIDRYSWQASLDILERVLRSASTSHRHTSH